jgi:Na+-driven multidrug efflux pump
MKDLTKGSPRKVILAFALPVLIGYVLQLCYSLADTRIVSSLLGADALSAVGSTSSLSALIIGFLNGLTNGFAVIIARFFGAGDEKGLKRAVAASLTCGILMALALTALILGGLPWILNALHTPTDIYPLAYRYISIIFMGMTISMLYNVSAGILRSIGDTTTPMLFLLLSVILNIFGDIFCIRVLHLGVAGAAIATVAAQLIATVACLIYMWKRYKILRIGPADFQFTPALVGNLMSCGLSMGFMSCLVNLGSLALQSGINGLGKDIIVAHTAARKISELYMLMFSVLGSTMATYCSQNYGAGNHERIRTGLAEALKIGILWCALVVLSCYTSAPLLIRLVTGDVSSSIVETAALYLRIDTLLYWVTAVICILRNALQGVGDHVTPVISSTIECVGKVIIVWLLVPRLAYMGIILAEPIVWVLMVIPLIIQTLRHPAIRK